MRPFFIVGPESWTLTPLTSTTGHRYREGPSVCVYLCVWSCCLGAHVSLSVRAITHLPAPENGAAQLFLLTVITITVNITSSMTAPPPTHTHHTHPFNSIPPKNLSPSHTHTACCSAGQSARSVDSLAGSVNNRNCRAYCKSGKDQCYALSHYT